MSGGAAGRRRWNEDAQRWEEEGPGGPGGPGEDAATVAVPVTPPPPPRPDHRPSAASAGRETYPDAASGQETYPDAPGAPDATTLTGAAWPPVTPPPAGPPDPRRGPARRTVWSVVVAAAAVGVVASLVISGVTKDGGDGTRAGGTVSPSQESGGQSGASDPAGSSGEPGTLDTATDGITDPTDTSGTQQTVLPDGYESVTDEEGFAIAVPVGWTRSTKASAYGIPVINYRSPDGSRRLQIYQVSESSPQESFELYLSDETVKPPGFQELSLDDVSDGDVTGAVLEYLADSLRGEPDVGTWHVVDERFEAADGERYAIAAYGADADGRDDERELVAVATSAFCPPGAQCPAATDSLDID